MNEEDGFEEWDADFLDQLIQVEELALSSTQHPPQPQPPPPPPPPFRLGSSDDNNFISYSPPRELSQRAPDCSKKSFNHSSNGVLAAAPRNVRRSGNADEVEIDKLKRELGRVSKQLSHLEQECSELRKERDKKEEQLKSVFSQIEAKDAEVHSLKSTHLENRVLQDHNGISPQHRNVNTVNEKVSSRLDRATSSYKGIGVQTEQSGDSPQSNVNNDVSTFHGLSNKLLGIWNSPSGQSFGRNLVSKLLVACSTDFQVLFGCLNGNMCPSITTKSLRDKSHFGDSLDDHHQSIHSSEAAKVSHLYVVLTKISGGMVQLEALFQALIALCNLENVVLVYRSLRVLHVVLNHVVGLESKSERRDNVMVDEPCYGNNIVDFNRSGIVKFGGLFSVNTKDSSYPGHAPFGMRLCNSEILHKNELCSYGNVISESCVDWVSLFELMHQIAMRNTVEHVKYEAVSIMNVIFMKSNAYLGREKFGQTIVFESISQLLKKEAGLRVRKQAVQFLYLSVNCPKLLLAFCSGCKEEEENAKSAKIDARNTPAFRGFGTILQGLSDCLAGYENGVQDLKLCRNALVVLAYLASSGKSGFEILLSHKLCKRTDFFESILRLLVSEMNLEELTDPPETFRQRTLLIREALIFLNRLASNPAYSAPVLRALTDNRDVASMTVDIANRLSQKGRAFWQSDSMTRQIRESEIVDLARGFKKRVFTYLGDSNSLNAQPHESTDLLY